MSCHLDLMPSYAMSEKLRSYLEMNRMVKPSCSNAAGALAADEQERKQPGK